MSAPNNKHHRHGAGWPAAVSAEDVAEWISDILGKVQEDCAEEFQSLRLRRLIEQGHDLRRAIFAARKAARAPSDTPITDETRLAAAVATTRSFAAHEPRPMTRPMSQLKEPRQGPKKPHRPRQKRAAP